MMEFGCDWRRFFLIILGVLCLAGAFVLVTVFSGRFTGPPEPGVIASDEFVTETGPAASKDGEWVIYVTGAVMRPGVYEVRPGGRVNDAVMAAGGPSAQADLEAINLAEKISDGTRVSVPFRLTEDASSSAGIDRQAGQSAVNPQPKPAPAGTANRVVVQGTTTPPRAAERAAKINVNSATADELRALPGIGEKLSLAIVQHREQNGPFDKPEDLLKVRGIGAKRFESIKDLVAVSN